MFDFEPQRDGGFTLVELLIVVVVLGILAGIVLPSFGNSADETKLAATVSNLKSMREALDLYRAQHNDRYPGYSVGGSGDPSAVLASDQLKLASKRDGSTAAHGTVGFTLGPYVRPDVPSNPFNDLRSIRVVSNGLVFPSAADDSTGWIYKPQTGEFRANTTFTTTEGRAVFDL